MEDSVISEAVESGALKAPETPPLTEQAPIEETVDVDAIMRAAEAKPRTEILIAPVQGTGEGQRAKRGRKKAEPPPPDPLMELLKQANFGKMAVAAQGFFFQACEAPPLTDIEAANTEAATIQLAHLLFKTAKTPEELVPVVAFASAMIMPVIVRAEPVGRAAAPFFKRCAEWINERATELKDRFTPKNNGAKRA